jgi:hypothetical protein
MYRERMHMSYAEALEEPNEAIETALVIWSLQDAHVKLEEAKRQHHNGGRQ